MCASPTTDAGVLALERGARPVTGARDDYDSLLDLVGTKRFVLIGEASHGTHDFYRERARITRRLIDECGSPRSRWKRTGRTRTGSIVT